MDGLPKSNATVVRPVEIESEPYGRAHAFAGPKLLQEVKPERGQSASAWQMYVHLLAAEQNPSSKLASRFGSPQSVMALHALPPFTPIAVASEIAAQVVMGMQ